MERETIREHTILVPASGPVLDVGSRAFAFSSALAARGLECYAMDPDPSIVEALGIPLIRKALVREGAPRWQRFHMDSDPQARRLMPRGLTEVECIDIKALMREVGVSHWGVVKLDCEAAEYGILATWPGPIADQITVEFHEHLGARDPKDYETILGHLGQWYDVVQHEKTLRHCIGTPNYWDSVFVRRGSR